MNYFIQFTICTAIFYIAFHFLFKDKNEHVFNRFYLLSSLLLSLVIPLLHIPFFPEYIDVVANTKPIQNVIEETVVPINTFSWKDGLLAIYLLGFIVHLALFISKLSSILRIVNSGKKITQNGVTKVITLANIPVSSFMNYLFIPKENEASITPYELRHETIHIRQKHSWDILFLGCVKIIFWINPFLILYQKRIVEIHEYLADENTSKYLGQDNYEQFLAQKTSISQQQLIHNFYTLFEKRIKMMNSEKKINKWQYAFLLPVLGLVFMAFSLESYPVYQVQNVSTISPTNKDSLPPIPPELIGQELDTIVTFDPVTYEEQISYVLSTGGDDAVPTTKIEILNTGIDTLVVFDPVDFSETVIIINHETGQRDTLR